MRWRLTSTVVSRALVVGLDAIMLMALLVVMLYATGHAGAPKFGVLLPRLDVVFPDYIDDEILRLMLWIRSDGSIVDRDGVAVADDLEDRIFRYADLRRHLSDPRRPSLAGLNLLPDRRAVLVASPVAAAGEGGVQPGLEDALGERRLGRSPPEGEHVGVVVLAAQPRAVLVASPGHQGMPEAAQSRVEDPALLHPQ